MSDRASASDERDLGVFIPSFLDDYGLDPYEFRIYSHIARRAGGSVCFEGLKGIARCCLMDIKTVRQKVGVLTDMGMLKCNLRAGMTHEFKLTRHSEWQHPETLEEVRSRHTPTRSGRGTKKGTTRSGTPPLPDQVPPPLPDQVPKGYPIKDIPLRESHEGTIANAIARENSEPVSVDVEVLDPEEAIAVPQASESPEPAQPEKPKRGRRGKSSGAAAGAQKAKDIYEQLQEPEAFESFWEWICGKYVQAPIASDGRRPQVGKKHEAAIAWHEHIELPGKLDDLRMACKHGKSTGAFDQVGLPHVCRWIRDGYWETILVQAGLRSGGLAFVEDEAAPVPTVSQLSRHDQQVFAKMASFKALMQARQGVAQ